MFILFQKLFRIICSPLDMATLIETMLRPRILVPKHVFDSTADILDI